MNKTGKLTQCVHAGGYLDEMVGGLTTPIHTASSFKFAKGGDISYPRYLNIPTQMSVASKIAALENLESALVFSSGMAAISTALLSLLKAGDHAVIHGNIYGGTLQLVSSRFKSMGIGHTLVNSEKIADFEEAVNENTKLIFFETPTNPLLSIVDIRAMVEMARNKGLLTVIDNTFASPINQLPGDMGVDMVIHSGTKYLNGHNDLSCGAVVASKPLIETVREGVIIFGGSLSSYDSYRLERGLKTLGIRIKQQNSTAMALANFLNGHEMVRKVFYPGLENNPGHDTASRQMSGFGGMLSVELDCGQEEALRIVGKLKYFTHAISLGGVESLVCFPSLTSHEMLTPEEKTIVGISDSLVRISVGIEDERDLIEDMKNALSR